jgi:hypothetical protein
MFGESKSEYVSGKVDSFRTSYTRTREAESLEVDQDDLRHHLLEVKHAAEDWYDFWDRGQTRRRGLVRLLGPGDPMVSQRPHTPDPYPEHCRRHPGARPSEATASRPAWTFTTRRAGYRSVVEPTTPRPGLVITIDHDQRPPDPFAANTTAAPRHRVRPQPSSLGQHRSPDPGPLRAWTMTTEPVAAADDLDEATGHGRLTPGSEPLSAPAETAPVLPMIEGTHRHRSSRGGTAVLPFLDCVAMAPRRDEPAGRRPKRRPSGRGAAEGGGAHRSLGNGETSCTGHLEVTVWR